MAIFRGIGGAGDSTTDATVTEVTQQAVNAADSATAASASASSAATSASNASTSATNAANSATSASNSASTASDAATAAQTAQTNAETAETNAESAQTAAELAETNAETAQAAAETAYDNFDDRYLGSKTSDPSVDNDGDALITGALYFNTTDDVMKVYNGTSWLAIPVSETYTGTVTSVGGTGTVNGLTLTGTVTTSGNLTLGGTLSVQASDIDSETATDGYVLTADGAGNAAWESVSSTGTVTSVSATVPTGFTISGSPITSSGTLAIGFDTGYALPTTASQTNWNTAYGWGDHSTAGYLTSYTETDPVVGAVTGIVKADGAGNISAAVAGTDYLASETYTGTVTSVSGTGTVNGLTLTGTVTTSGDLTLGGTLAVQAGDIDSQTATDGYVLTADGAGNAAWEVAPAGYTDSDVDTHLNTATASSGEVLSWTGTDYDWIAAGGGGGASALTIDTKSAAYTVVSGDLGKIIFMSNTGNVTLPDPAVVGLGFWVIVKVSNNRTSGNTLVPSVGTIAGLSNFALDVGMSVRVISDGANWITDRDGSHMFSYQTYGSKEQARATGSRSIALGDGASAANNYSTALGKNAKATATNSLAIGSTNASTNATGTASAAIGANSGTSGSQAAGSGAMALGGSRASGTDSFAAAIANNTSTYGATATGAVAMGYQSKASGTYAFSAGRNGTASADRSLNFGSFSNASGSSSAILAGISCSATQPYSLVLNGAGSTSSIYGKIVWGNHGLGNCHGGMYRLFSETADATPKVMATSTQVVSSTNQIILFNNSANSFHGTIVARQQASAGTACAAWKIEGLIRREGSAGTTVLVNSAITVLDNTPAWGMALSADTTNGGLKIEVTGEAATNIRWVATVHTSEVTY